MRLRFVFCVTIALLSVAAAGMLDACSSGACSETLTCDGSSEGGEDGTVDSPPDVGSDVARDGTTLEASLDSAMDGSDAGEGSADAEDSSADATDGPTDAPSDAKDAADAGDAPGDVVEAAAVCGAPFTCIPAVPAGFSGPVAFVQEAPASGDAPTPPACASPYTVPAVNGVSDPLASPPTCTCTCSGVDGGCSVPTVHTFLDNVCVNQCNLVSAPSCVPSGCGSTSQSAIVSVPVPMGGACTESVQKTVPAWNAAQDWAVTGRACATSATLTEGGCTGTEILRSGSVVCLRHRPVRLPGGQRRCLSLDLSRPACPLRLRHGYPHLRGRLQLRCSGRRSVLGGGERLQQLHLRRSVLVLCQPRFVCVLPRCLPSVLRERHGHPFRRLVRARRKHHADGGA